MSHTHTHTATHTTPATPPARPSSIRYPSLSFRTKVNILGRNSRVSLFGRNKESLHSCIHSYMIYQYSRQKFTSLVNRTKREIPWLKRQIASRPSRKVWKKGSWKSNNETPYCLEYLLSDESKYSRQWNGKTGSWKSNSTNLLFHRNNETRYCLEYLLSDESKYSRQKSTEIHRKVWKKGSWKSNNDTPYCLENLLSDERKYSKQKFTEIHNSRLATKYSKQQFTKGCSLLNVLCTLNKI